MSGCGLDFGQNESGKRVFGDYVMEVPNLYRKEAVEYRDIAQAGRVPWDRQRHEGLGLLF
jgi:hypothetical protein